MHIDDTALREAMLRILNGWEIQHGIEITRAQLETQWLRTGLRHSDLKTATWLMLQNGGLRAVGARFHLVPRVLEMLSLAPESVDEQAALAIAHAELYRAMQRRRSAIPGHDRREADRYEMALLH